VRAEARRGPDARMAEDARDGAEVLSRREEHRRASVPEAVPRHVR